ncbi:hypothetical protein QQP08_024323 [Theobroma cacao]|nr:hypothetical protein QQP08_024323 [Theobroma cacao]
MATCFFAGCISEPPVAWHPEFYVCAPHYPFPKSSDQSTRQHGFLLLNTSPSQLDQPHLCSPKLSPPNFYQSGAPSI